MDMETTHRKLYYVSNKPSLSKLHGSGVAWSAKRYLPPALPLTYSWTI